MRIHNRYLDKATLRSLAVAVAVWALPTLARGAPSPSPSPSPKPLDTVVVTAQRHASALRNTPRETIVISAADLLRAGARTIGDALRFVPAAVVSGYGASGQLQTVGLRNASAAQTLVLLDGRPVNEPDTGVTDYSSLPLDNVNRIEIVEGSVSTLYGSAAVGGVVNVITDPGSGGRRSGGYVELGYEGAFREGISFSAGSGSGPAFDASLRSVHSQNTYDYPAFFGAAAGIRTNNDVKVQDAAASLQAVFGKTRAALYLQDDQSAQGSPGDVTCCASGLARQQRSVSRALLTLDSKLGGGTIGLQAYSDGKRLHFADATLPFPYDTLSASSSKGFALRDTFRAGALHEITIGYDVRGDRTAFLSGLSVAPALVAGATSAVYLDDELHAPGAGLRLSAGWRHERVQGSKAAAVPSFGLSQRLGKSVILRANYGRAFRAPSLDERYYPGFGNAALEPEYAATFDIGAVGELAGGDASLTYFETDTNNLIVALPIDSFGDVKPFNVARARARGLSASANLTLSSRTRLKIAYTDSFEAKDMTSGRRLPYRPAFSLGAQLWRSYGTIDMGVDGRINGDRYAPTAGGPRRMGGYGLADAFFIRRFGPNARATLRWENITGNHKEEDILGYPVMGPTLSLRLSLSR